MYAMNERDAFAEQLDPNMLHRIAMKVESFDPELSETYLEFSDTWDDIRYLPVSAR